MWLTSSGKRLSMMVNELHSVDSFAVDSFASTWRLVDNASAVRRAKESTAR